MTHQELIRRMLAAWFQDEDYTVDGALDHMERMAAVLKVAGEELLSPLTEAEKDQAGRDWYEHDSPKVVSGWDNYHHCTLRMLERRLAKLNPNLADRVMPILDKWFTQHSEETQRRVAEEIANLMKKEESK